MSAEDRTPAPGEEGARLVVSYLGEDVFHRSHPDDDMRPACDSRRLRGTLVLYTTARRERQSPCPFCWSL